MNSVSKISAAAMVSAILVGCQATGSQLGWRETPRIASPIVVSLDRGGYASEENFRGDTPFWDDIPRDVWVTRLGDRRGSLPRLVTIYTEFPEPDTGLTAAWPVQQTFREQRSEFFQSRSHEVGVGRDLIVRGLPVEIADVTTSGAACFTFATVYGERSKGLVGSKSLNGYHCRRGEEPISDAEAMEVLSAISTPGWR